MSRSDWGKFAKIVGLTSAAFLLAALLYGAAFIAGTRSGYYEGQAERTAAQYPSDTQRIIDDCFKLPARAETVKCVEEATNASHENQRSEKDLVAQRQMSDWAWWVMIIGVLQFFATIATLGFIKLTLDATLEAVRDTSVATEAMDKQTKLMTEAQRPWLDFEVVAVHPSPYTAADSINVELRISNHSSFPAHEVRGVGRGHFCSSSLIQPLSTKSSRDEVRAVLDDWGANSKGGEVVFPGKDHMPTAIANIGDPEDYKAMDGPNLMTRVTIGIRYTFDGGTGYTFRDYLLFGLKAALDKAHSGTLPRKDALSYPRITIGADDSSGRAT